MRAPPCAVCVSVVAHRAPRGFETIRRFWLGFRLWQCVCRCSEDMHTRWMHIEDESGRGWIVVKILFILRLNGSSFCLSLPLPREDRIPLYEDFIAARFPLLYTTNIDHSLIYYTHIHTNNKHTYNTVAREWAGQLILRNSTNREYSETKRSRLS